VAQPRIREAITFLIPTNTFTATARGKSPWLAAERRAGASPEPMPACIDIDCSSPAWRSYALGKKVNNPTAINSTATPHDSIHRGEQGLRRHRGGATRAYTRLAKH
jgi:hypothetical protein